MLALLQQSHKPRRRMQRNSVGQIAIGEEGDDTLA
jgi:hypothetical protein